MSLSKPYNHGQFRYNFNVTSFIKDPGPTRTFGDGHKNFTNPAANKSSKYFFITHYGPPALDLRNDQIIGAKGQFEIGTAGKIHLQLVVHFNKHCKGPGARKILGMPPTGGYCEPVISLDGALRYVSDPDKRLPGTEPIEIGMVGIGKGNSYTYASVVQEIKDGKTREQIMAEYPSLYLQRGANLDKLCAQYDKPRTRAPTMVIVFYGPTGTGKSRYAADCFPHAYRKTMPGEYWENYSGEECVIFEEFNPNQREAPSPTARRKEMPLNQLLVVLDGQYGCRMNRKFSSVQIKAHDFVFTTNINPIDWYDGEDPENRKALFRRIDAVFHFPVIFNKKTMKEPVINRMMLLIPGFEDQAREKMKSIVLPKPFRASSETVLAPNPLERQPSLAPYEEEDHLSEEDLQQLVEDQEMFEGETLPLELDYYHQH